MAPFEECICLCCHKETLPTAWAGSPAYELADIRGGFRSLGTAGADKCGGIGGDVLTDGELAHHILEVDYSSGIHDRGDLRIVTAGGFEQDTNLLGGGGVVDVNGKHEAVELRLGEGVSALELYRVLSSEIGRAHV